MTKNVQATAYAITATGAGGTYNSAEPSGGSGGLLFTPDYNLDAEGATLGQTYSGSGTDQWTDASGATTAQNTEVLYGAQAWRYFKLAATPADGGGFGQWGGRKQLDVQAVKGDVVHCQWSVFLPTAFDWTANPWLKFFRFLISASDDSPLGHLDMYIHNNNPGTDPDGNLAYHSEVWPYSLGFNSGGTYEVLAGDTITGQTSGATAVVHEVVLLSGTWAGGDAQGNLKYVSEIGDLASGELLDVGANLNVATTTNSGVAGGTADIITGEIMTKNTWETFEMEVTLDDVEVDRGGTGRVRIWRNKSGVMTLIGDYTDLPTLQTSTDKCPTILMWTYWNSGAEDGTYPATDQTAYGDRVIIQQDQSKLVETDAGGNKIIGGLA